ncbi:MAG TPA: O-antigen ligase family protein, partial [Bacteroidales bacterium]|nr:O-antigen ligase family protein [Bacteroidales bacterium]
VFRYVLIRERMTVFGFLLIVPVFMMARRNLSVFVNVLVATSIVVYLMYFITATTNFDLLPLWQAERYRGTGILRYLMFSSGLSDMLIPLSVFVFARRIDYRYRNLLFGAVVLMLLSVLLSLTKSSYINVAGLVIASLFLYYRFYGASFRGLMAMLLGPGILMFLFMLMVFPEYPRLVWRQVADLWLFITGDAYTSGMVEGRLVNQWPAHLALISQRPWFGTGAGFSDFFSLRFHPSDYEVTDLPITGHLAMYGVVGLAIYSLFYIQIWRYVVTTYRMIKSRVLELNDLDIALFFVVFAWMVKTFFFKPNYLFNELTTGTLLINLYAGILAALIYRIRKT